MSKKEYLIKDLENKTKNVFKTGADGTKYYLLSLDEIQEVLDVLEEA